ncbi:MAG TPA: hypothetical protein EYN27_07250 [Rhodospirillales bacterium]|nr:hypothetical protein [Rhodospirillales bacterium]
MADGWEVEKFSGARSQAANEVREIRVAPRHHVLRLPFPRVVTPAPPHGKDVSLATCLSEVIPRVVGEDGEDSQRTGWPRNLVFVPYHSRAVVAPLGRPERGRRHLRLDVGKVVPKLELVVAAIRPLCLE